MLILLLYICPDPASACQEVRLVQPTRSRPYSQYNPLLYIVGIVRIYVGACITSQTGVQNSSF